MVSKDTSKPSASFRRAKSSSEIRPQRATDQYDLVENEETARYFAITAAELAFEHAKERVVGMKLKQEQETGKGDQQPTLARRKSIRFAGPSAVPMKGCSITRRNAPEYNIGLKAREGVTLSDGYSTDAEQSTARKLSTATHPRNGQFNEHESASQPSSYRKLRKSKSMFALEKTPSAVFPNGVSMAGRHFQRQSMRSSDSWGEPIRKPDPRLRKSFSFLRGVADRLPTSNRRYTSHDEAVQMARDQYLRQLEQQRLKEQPSFLNLLRRRKSQKVFRRTVRGSGINSYGCAVGSPKAPAEVPQPGRIGQKARCFSVNVRKRLKRVFWHSISEDDTVPAQHLDASRAHYGSPISSFEQARQWYPPVPSPDAELLRRVGSRESMLRTSPVFVEAKSVVGSIRSAPSESDLGLNKSRATSWTDSTAANTINMPQHVERKRLSVIKEDGGPHQPSSSARKVNNVASGYDAFRQPFRQPVAGTLPEPQRVFSALQKEIIKKRSHPQLDDSDPGTDSSSERAWSQSAHATLQRSSKGPQVRRDLLTHHPPGHLDYAETAENLTPQQIAVINESGGIFSKRPMQEVGSGFFHANTRIEQERSTSPYRRIMHSDNDYDRGSHQDFALTSSSQQNQPAQPMSAQHPFGIGAKSESVYSRTSGGHTPKAIGSSVSLMRSEISEEPGTAIILATETARCAGTPKALAPYRNVSDRSSHSSREWKQRLASDLAYFLGQSPVDDVLYDGLPGRDRGHMRESAQLDAEDVAIGRSYRAAPTPKQPLGLIQISMDNQSGLQQKESNSTLEQFPLSKRATPSPRVNAARRNENTYHSQSSLQTEQAAKSATDKEQNSARKSSASVRQRISQASLVAGTENLDSPANSNSRLSPERAERIRRLQSKSSLSLHKVYSLPNSAAQGYLTENKIATNSITSASGISLLRDSGLKENIPNMDQLRPSATRNKDLVDGFLQDRRRETRISEESGGNPAFL